MASLPTVKAATGHVLSTRSLVDHGHRPAASCDTSLVVSGTVDCGRRLVEMFMTRSLNVMPKTTEQRI